MAVGNITYQKAYRKQQKKSYRGLTDNQRKYIKARERWDQMDKALSSFYSQAKRTETGVVDFEHMTDNELDTFDFWNKEKEKAMRTMDKLENIIDVNYTLNVFLQINMHSMSF